MLKIALMMVLSLSLTLWAKTVLAAPPVPLPPESRGATFWLVQQKAPPTTAQLKARQEARILVNKQLLILKKMRVEQSQLQQQQRKLIEQSLKRQNTQSRRRQLQFRQAEAQEEQKRKVLLDTQRVGQNLPKQRAEQTAASRINQRNKQEQDIRKESSALQSYYESLARRTLRAQNDRLAPADTPRVP